MSKITVFTGAGVSEESGIRTFRGNNGLWDEYKIEEVATPQAWVENPKLVLEFYNKRRLQVISAQPNKAHHLIAELEENHEVKVITQNIDDLHERAGSTNVLHVHGEIMKSKSILDDPIDPVLYDVKNGVIEWGENCPKGGQLRPHVVWFGEAVPSMEEAEQIVQESEIFIVVGTSLNVYPAAGLVYNAQHTRNFLVDPNSVKIPEDVPFTVISEKASKGMEEVIKYLKGMTFST